MGSPKIPQHADTVVVGGGTAGAAVAGILAERSEQSVLLLEAGPDYGPFVDGRWPSDLTDARLIPTSHDWGYNSGAAYKPRVIAFERARVAGGCSSHNGCAAIWGSRFDYDGWAALGNAGWSAAELLPRLESASKRLRVRIPARDEITPYQEACLDAASNAGIPSVSDLNDLDENIGMGPSPVNVADGVRWNTSFAYLDPVRERRNLTIVGKALVDRLLIRGSRISGLDLLIDGKPASVAVGRVILAAGAYGSPAILMRSGVGDPETLRAAGIQPTLELSGVGRNLHDHPRISLRFSGTSSLTKLMREFGAARWMPEEQTIAKARSSRCADAFDLHIYPVGGSGAMNPAKWYWTLEAACLTPRSRGWMRLASRDPNAAPIIDHRYLSDAGGDDAKVLEDGLCLARRIAAQNPLAPLIGRELEPGPAVTAGADIAEFVRANVLHYYHPVGTGRMGPAGSREAVVNPRGKIHGLDNGFIADASIMPIIPRANTNLPALVVGERVARWLLGE